MNNFVFSQDPLLYNNFTPMQPTTNDVDIKRQLDTILAQYQMMQQQQAPTPPEQHEDYLGNLDEMVKNLDQSIVVVLNNNEEFLQLNAWIQSAIQTEIMKSIKHKLNSNSELVSKVNRIKEIIRDAKNQQDLEDRRSLNELNDYITNYSDMTFNEYKQLKASK
jgi:sugar-specific transcriptional regulator TrmB